MGRGGKKVITLKIWVRLYKSNGPNLQIHRTPDKNPKLLIPFKIPIIGLQKNSNQFRPQPPSSNGEDADITLKCIKRTHFPLLLLNFYPYVHIIPLKGLIQ